MLERNAVHEFGLDGLDTGEVNARFLKLANRLVVVVDLGLLHDLGLIVFDLLTENYRGTWSLDLPWILNSNRKGLYSTLACYPTTSKHFLLLVQVLLLKILPIQIHHFFLL